MREKPTSKRNVSLTKRQLKRELGQSYWDKAKNRVCFAFFEKEKEKDWIIEFFIRKKNIEKVFKYEQQMMLLYNMYTYRYRSGLNLLPLLGQKTKFIPYFSPYETRPNGHQKNLFSYNKIKIFNFSLATKIGNSTNFSKNTSYFYCFKSISVKQILRSTFGRIEFYLNTFEIE